MGSVIAQGLGLIASVVTARLLGNQGFGELAMIQSTTGMFGVVAGLGLGMTATKYVAEFRRSDPDRAGRIIGLSSLVALISGGVLSLCIVLCAPFLAKYTMAAPQLANPLRVASGLLFFNCINGAQTGTLLGLESFKGIAKANIVRGIIAFPAIISGLLLWHLIGAVGGQVAAAALGCFSNYLLLQRECRYANIAVRHLVGISEWRVLYRFSVPALLSNLSVTPVTWLVNTLLIRQPGGYAELGIYNAVQQLKTAIQFVPSTLMQPLLPILSELYGQKNASSYGRTLSAAYILSIGLLAPAGLIFIAWPELAAYPYGKAYSAHPALIQWLMLHTLLVGLFSPIGSILPSMNKMWFGCCNNLGWGIVFLALSTLLVPRYAATGLAIAFTSAHLIISLLNFGYIAVFRRSYFGEFPLLRFTVLLTIASTVCIGLSHSFSRTVSVLAAFAFAAATTVLLWRQSSAFRTLAPNVAPNRHTNFSCLAVDVTGPKGEDAT